MKINKLSSEYALCDKNDEVIGVANVTKNGDDATLVLTLGDKLTFESKEEVAAFLEQILNIME